MLRLAILITLAGMAVPTDDTAPISELRMLRATVKMQAAHIVRLTARIVELEAAAKRPTTRPDKTTTTKPVAKVAPTVKILSLSDLLLLMRKDEARRQNLTQIQRKAIPNPVRGKWARFSVTVTGVSSGTANRRGKRVETAKLSGTYATAARVMVSGEKHLVQRPGYKAHWVRSTRKGNPAATVHLVARIPAEGAIKIRRHSKIVVVGKIEAFTARKQPTRHGGGLIVNVKLDARQPPPAKGKAL